MKWQKLNMQAGCQSLCQYKQWPFSGSIHMSHGEHPNNKPECIIAYCFAKMFMPWCFHGGTQVCFFLTKNIILNTVHVDAAYLT